MTGLHLLGISRERPIVCLHYRLAQPVDPAANARASREKVSLPMRRSSPAVELRYAREACARSRRRSLPLGTEAVAQTPGELAGSFLRVGSERGPSPPPHAEGQSPRRPARQPWGVLPRAWSGLSEMALRDSPDDVHSCAAG